MSSKLKLLILPILILGIWLAGGRSLAFEGGISAAIPSNPDDASSAIVASTITIPPPESVIYVETSEAGLVLPTNRPTAILNEELAQSYESISVYLADDSVLEEAQSMSRLQPSFVILSSIKYTTPEGNLLVTTTKPHLTGPDQSLLLGAQVVTLANGVTAWATSYEHGDYPNRVIFAHDNLLITVAGFASVDEIQDLANNIIIKE